MLTPFPADSQTDEAVVAAEPEQRPSERTVPEITGLYYIGLSVRDNRRSTAWYAELLGLAVVVERIADDGRAGEVLLRHPGTGMLLGFLSHRANPGDAICEVRTGLDRRSAIGPWREGSLMLDLLPSSG